MKRAAFVSVGLLILAGCATNTPAPVVHRGVQSGSAQLPGAASPASSKDYYTVKKGDTLYSIALDHGHDYRDLVAWNRIENPGRILVGQQLRVTPPSDETPAETPVAVTAPIGAITAVEVRPLDEQRPPSANSDTLKREPKAGKEPYSDAALAQAQRSGDAATKGDAVAPPVVAVAAPRPEPAPEQKPAIAGELPWGWPAAGKLVGNFVEGSSKGIDITGKAGDPVMAAAAGKVVYSGVGLRGYGKLVIVKHDAGYLSAYAHNQSILVKEGQTVGLGQKIAEMGSSDADQVKLHFEIRREGKPVDPLKYLPRR